MHDRLCRVLRLAGKGSSCDLVASQTVQGNRLLSAYCQFGPIADAVSASTFLTFRLEFLVEVAHLLTVLMPSNGARKYRSRRLKNFPFLARSELFPSAAHPACTCCKVKAR